IRSSSTLSIVFRITRHRCFDAHSHGTIHAFEIVLFIIRKIVPFWFIGFPFSPLGFICIFMSVITLSHHQVSLGNRPGFLC
ncbi:hypothetical protein K435DRAFT_781100, partial [Dendrothele bispora CBS 962.96]